MNRLRPLALWPRARPYSYDKILSEYLQNEWDEGMKAAENPRPQKRPLKPPVGEWTAELHPLQLGRLWKTPARAPTYLQFLRGILPSEAVADVLSKASATWSKVTGYDEIVEHKDHVVKVQREVEDAMQRLTSAQLTFEKVVREASIVQREINELEKRRASWVSSDVKALAELLEKDQQLEKHVAAARSRMSEMSELVEAKHIEFTRSALERYGSEHTWSVRKSLVSTFGAATIFVLNIIMLTISLLIVEPTRRRHLVQEAVEATASAARAVVEQRNMQFADELRELKALVQASNTPWWVSAGAAVRRASASAFSVAKSWSCSGYVCVRGGLAAACEWGGLAARKWGRSVWRHGSEWWRQTAHNNVHSDVD